MYSCMKVQYNEHLVSTVDTDGLVLSTRASVHTHAFPAVYGLTRAKLQFDLKSNWMERSYKPGMCIYIPVVCIILLTHWTLGDKAVISNVRDSAITAPCVIYPLKLKRDSSTTNYLPPASWRRILKLPVNKNINVGTHSQCSRTHKNNGPS